MPESLGLVQYNWLNLTPAVLSLEYIHTRIQGAMLARSSLSVYHDTKKEN